MPRINLTPEELSAIEPVLTSFRTAQSLRAERIRTLLSAKQAFEAATYESWDLPMILETLSDVEKSL